ncbi:hypothetical protein CL648_04815 [bacterium]|nr:hypothetical protein [bacterium]|tara:strand:+ start:340 stop:930 length:591 start_codon:yes stop_codon:yes gene_type:complete
MRWIGIGLGILIHVGVVAATIPSPNVFLQEVFTTVSSYTQTVSNNVQSTQDIIAAIQTVVEDSVDFELMAKLSVGRSAWSEAKPKERLKFVKTFKSHLFDTYLSQFLDYESANLVVKFGETKQRGNKAKVPCVIQSGDSQFSGAFKVYLNQSKWKIYDVDMEGVSLIAAFRVQFSAPVRDGGLVNLTRKLERMNRS